MAEEILVNRGAMEAAAQALNTHANNLQTHLDNTQRAMTRVLATWDGASAQAYMANVHGIKAEIDNLRGLATATQGQVNSHSEQTFAVDNSLASAFEQGTSGLRSV